MLENGRSQVKVAKKMGSSQAVVSRTGQGSRTLKHTPGDTVKVMAPLARHPWRYLLEILEPIIEDAWDLSYIQKSELPLTFMYWLELRIVFDVFFFQVE